MGKAEYGSPKYIAKQMKSRGLQRLRWYCQVCEKQCRDENGYKCHTQAPSHAAKLREKGDRKHTEEYSQQFEADFLQALRLSHGTKPVAANRVYNEYIHNKTHIHMTATKWPSLAAFVRHLEAAGLCSVKLVAGEGPPESIIALVDRSDEVRRAKQEQAKEQRAQANDLAARRVLQAQLRAAQEDKDHLTAAQARPPLCTSVQPNSAHSSFDYSNENNDNNNSIEQRSEVRSCAQGKSDTDSDHATTPPDAALQPPQPAAAKPAKISFSLARKRNPAGAPGA